jgi:hypothetical protein
MIVDSCIDYASRTAPALEYLQSIGVNPSTAVRLILATHWHDDHVRGLAQILGECTSALFACSAALKPDEIIEGIGSLSSDERFLAQTSGVKEMHQALRSIRSAGRPNAKWAIVDRTLWVREGKRLLPSRVHVLAPSDGEVLAASHTIAALLRAGQERRVPRPERNEGSVVLWVQIGAAGLLLGGDLEETNDLQTGWTAVADCGSRPSGRSQVFKVPHHGSRNAHQDRVWDEMLIPQPHAVLAPWSLGHSHLPTNDDIARICRLTNQLHLTAVPRARLRERRTIGRRWRARQVERPAGRVTLRCADPRNHPEDWVASYVDPAHQVCP